MKSRRRKSKRKSGNSPEEAGQPPSPFRFRGLWRDEKLLVIDLANHRFPRRCLKSNQLVESLERVTLTYSKPTFEEVQMLSSRTFPNVNIRIVKRSKQWEQVLIELPIPLSPWWRGIWLTSWGKRSIGIGLAVLAAGIVGSRWNEDLGYFSFVMGLLLTIVAAAFQFSLSWVLPVYRVSEGKIWIGGVHRDWLQRLSTYTPSRTMLAEEIWLLTASFWVCFWAGVFVLGLFLWGHLIGEGSKAEYKYVNYALLTGAAVAILMGNRARMLLRSAKQQLAALDPPVRRKHRR